MLKSSNQSFPIHPEVDIASLRAEGPPKEAVSPGVTYLGNENEIDSK